jgi:VWFA-related protein
MRSLVVAAVMLSAVPMSAQASQTPLTERVEVNVVNVDVTVLDRHGNPVRGLTAVDFEVFEDGVAQKITNFYAVANSAEESASTSQTTPERFRRKVLVVIDNFGLRQRPRRDMALAKLQQFVESDFNADYEWSVAAIGGRAQLLLPLTTDKQKIRHALESLQRHDSQEKINFPVLPLQTSAGGNSCFVQWNNALEQSMLAPSMINSVLQAERALAASEGKKIILLLSSGIPMPQVGVMCPEYVSQVQAMRSETVSLRDYLIREANASNVNFYIINPEGLLPQSFAASTNEILAQNGRGDAFSVPDHDISPSDTSTLFWLATETGGRFMPGNFVDQSLREFNTAASNFYSLGYSPKHAEDGRYHKIAVRLTNNRGYTLQHRDGYSNVPNQTQLQRALRSPMGVGMLNPTLPVAMTSERALRNANHFEVPIRVEVPLDKLQFVSLQGESVGLVDVYVSIFDAGGHNLLLKHFTHRSSHPTEKSASEQRFSSLDHVKLPEGTYQIIVVVRDQLSEAVGMSIGKLTL